MARAFRTVFLPLSLPGLAAGTLIVFILCLGFYVTPAVLGGGKVIMVSNHIANDIELFFNWGAASALGVVLLVLAALLVPVGDSTPLQFDNYIWAPDAKRLMLFTNTKQVWRQNTRGDYWVLDRATGALRQLGGAGAPP